MIYHNVDEVTEKNLNHFLADITLDWKHKREIVIFIFDCVNLLHEKCHKINLKRGGSYIDYPDWIKTKKVTINPVNDDNKCFQYAATVALNYEEIGKNSERISKNKPFVNKCK